MGWEIRLLEEGIRCWGLFSDGECVQVLHTSIFGRHPRLPRLSQDSTLNKEEIQKWIRKRAIFYVYRRLTAKAYHSKELEQLLLRKEIPFSIIQSILEDCTEKGYLNDSQWVDSRKAREQRLGKGPLAIAQKLRSKGVDQEEVEKVLEETSFDEEVRTMRDLLERKNRTLKGKDKAKLWSFFARRGFRTESIREVLDSIAK